MILIIVVLPIAYVAWVATALVRRRWSDVGLSLAMAATTFAVGAWAILQSRASTASIGFLFLPMLAAAAGLLALAYSASRRARSPMLRVVGIVALIAAVLPAAASMRGGRRSIARNASRDADQLRRDTAYARYRARFDTLVASSGDRAADTVQGLLRANRDDRELVLAALERPQVTAPLLDTFARSPDLGIALQAIRNANTSAQTLERVYRTHQYRNYFLQALVAHPNTPSAILREIHGLRPAPITGLDIWFAGNPATPTDVLRDVARTTESIDAVRTLLRHPALDCAIVESVAVGPAVRSHPAVTDAAEQLANARAAHCR